MSSYCLERVYIRRENDNVLTPTADERVAAYQIAQALFYAGLWDGKCVLWVFEPLATLALLVQNGRRGAALQEDVDYARPGKRLGGQ